MDQEKSIRLLIADDSRDVRESLVQLLEPYSEIIVAAQAATGGEVLERVREQAFDLVILDVTMPVRNGLEVLYQLKRDRPSLPVIVLSIYPPELYEKKSLSMGAAAYVSKECAATMLVPQIRRTMGIV